MTESLFFNWLTLMEDIKWMLFLSSIALLVFLISVFDELKNLQEILWGKLSLWSFTVTYICYSGIFSILSSIDKAFEILFVSLFILFTQFLLVFLWAFVIFLLSSFVFGLHPFCKCFVIYLQKQKLYHCCQLFWCNRWFVFESSCPKN